MAGTVRQPRTEVRARARAAARAQYRLRVASAGCCVHCPRDTPLSVRERGANSRMSLVSPPSEPKLTTVPVPSARSSAMSPSRAPPTLSIATWIFAPSAAALARSFQPATSVAKIGDPGRSPASFSAPASLRTSLMTFTPRSVRSLPRSRPTADPAAVSSTTTPVRASGGTELMRRADRCDSRGRVDQHLRADLVRNRVWQRHHGASRNDDFVPPRAWCRKKRHPEARSQSQTRVDEGADLAHDASAFESGDSPTGADRRRRSERRRTHDSQQIAWMDRRVGYADPNLIWSERLRWAVFDPKHLRRLSEFVVNNSFHALLPAAERRTSLPINIRTTASARRSSRR